MDTLQYGGLYENVGEKNGLPMLQRIDRTINGDTWATPATGNARTLMLLDVNGDGLDDIVRTEWNHHRDGVYVNRGNWSVCRLHIAILTMLFNLIK